MKKTLLAIIGLAASLFPGAVSAQDSKASSESRPRNVFTSLELAANIGTTGLGLEVASPVTDWAKLRVGFDCMPHFKSKLNMEAMNYIGDKRANNMDQINQLMYNQTGYSISPDVNLEAKPTLNSFRLLVDVYPFKSNRHWHFTAGFFVSGSSISTVTNLRSDMPSLMAMKMYDSLYKNTTSQDFVDNPEKYPLFGILTFDKETAESFQNKMLSAGQVGVYAGDHKDGTPCILLPNEEGLLKLKSKVNAFRPYLGFGYGGSISPDGKWQASFDAGIQIWGGTPRLTASDGTVINDLYNLSKDTQSYIDLLKLIPVFPTLDLRISYRF